jgi:hypothetical protein
MIEQWVKVTDGFPEFFWNQTHWRTSHVLTVTHDGFQKIEYMNASGGNGKPWNPQWSGWSPSNGGEEIAMWRYLDKPPIDVINRIWSPRYRAFIHVDYFDQLENAPDHHITC